MLTSRSVRAAALLIAVLACDTSRDASETSGRLEWTGTERDSAGIRIVSNPSDGNWTDATRWRVESDLSIGVADGAPEYQFGRIVDVDVAGDSAIYVLDQQAAQISVFSNTGAHLFSFGREGEGPGELSSQSPMGALAVLTTSQGEVLVPDRVNVRVTRFGLDGGVIGTFPLGVEGGEPVSSSILPNGDYLVHRVGRAPGSWNGLLQMGSDGQVLDTIAEFDLKPAPWGMSTVDEQGRRQALEHTPLWAVLPDGRLVSGRSDEYRMEVQAPDGSLEMIVLKEEEEPVLTGEGREKYTDRLGEIWAEMFRRRGDPEELIRSELSKVEDIYILPERLPTFTGFKGGPEGTIWVRRPLPVESITSHLLGPRPPLREFWSPNWEVFSREGRFMGEVELPPRFTLHRIRNGSIYGVEADDLGVQRVVRLTIQIP